MIPGDMDAPAIAKFAQIAIFHEQKKKNSWRYDGI